MISDTIFGDCSLLSLTFDRDLKGNLNSTDAKLAPQNLAPTFFLLKQLQGWFIWVNVIRRFKLRCSVDNGHNFDGRSFSAHIHCTLIPLTGEV